MTLSGKKALVTGGTRGIGREITRTFAQAGTDVLACYRHDGTHVDDLARELKKTGGDHHLIQADVVREADITRLIDECRTRFGSLDVIVNNAGRISHQPLERLEPAEWAGVLNANLTAAYLVIRSALPLLGSNASVINIGSRVATVGIPMRAHYTAAKAGLIGLTRSLCKELGPRGIRVNVVAPGVIATEVELPSEVVEKYVKLTALQRLGRPADIAAVVAFLASDASAYVTGTVINVDGGI
jgi:3-oxoacyl-[acyl-carrier protein] reductase